MLLSEDFEENPGTLALSASWVLIFVLMLLTQWYQSAPTPPPGPRWEPLPISTTTSHRFGDMTWAEVRQGQYWRLLTATFIHFGLIHIAVNAMGMINLGRLIEPWYRTGPFLAICLAMGGLGNLVGGVLRRGVTVARPWLAEQASIRHLPGTIERLLRGNPGPPLDIHTGGGSTILLGLLALGAVVGWRSKTRIGAHLQKQMLMAIALTAALGIALSGLVDNYGHLGGAIVGGLIGLVDRPLIRLSESRWFRVVCWGLSLTVVIACFGSAIRDDRIDVNYREQLSDVLNRGRVAESTLDALTRLRVLYASATFPSEAHRMTMLPFDAAAMNNLLTGSIHGAEPLKPDPARADREGKEMAGVIDRLDHIIGLPWGKEIAVEINRLCELARKAEEAPPRFAEVYEFVVSWNTAVKAVAADLVQIRAKFVAIEANHKRGR